MVVLHVSPQEKFFQIVSFEHPRTPTPRVFSDVLALSPSIPPPFPPDTPPLQPFAHAFSHIHIFYDDGNIIVAPTPCPPSPFVVVKEEREKKEKSPRPGNPIRAFLEPSHYYVRNNGQYSNRIL